MLGLFGGAKPDHPLADPREAKRLIESLPAQDPLKALEELAHWHESVAATEGFRPDARFELLFLLDEAAQPRLRKVARDYLAAARPSRFQENRMWTHVYDYWRLCAHAYAKAIDAVLQGAKGAEAARAQLPLAATRALRAIAQQIKWLHLRYAPVDAAVWRVLNGVYAFAELRNITGATVPAVYPGVPGESSPKLEFVRALVLNVSSPDSLLPPQVEAAERLIADFAPAFAFGAEAAGATHWVDLAQGAGPQRLVKAPPSGPGVRFLGSGAALQALHSMLARIESTSILPEAFGPGAPISDGEQALDLLRHLLLYWAPAAPERKHPRHNVKSRLSIVHGFDAVLGALSSAGAAAPAPGEAQLDFGLEPAESWIVENVSAGGFGAVVPQAKGDWLKIGALLAMQPDGGNNWIVGVIRRVSRSASQEARVGIQTLSRAPEVTRFALHGKDEAGILLPAPGLGSGEASIALHAGVFVPGQNLQNERAGRGYMYMPQGVVERGDDYDIVRFREMLRES